MRIPFPCFLLGLALAVSSAKADGSFQIDQPSVDRWMYPFNGELTTRGGASTFGAVGDPETDARFDNRDAQFLVRFDTSSIATPGQGASSYVISSLQLALTVLNNSATQPAFVYDSSYDSYKSSLPDTSPDYVPDADGGSPVELFAVGYRNGYTAQSFQQDSPFMPGNVFTDYAPNVRNAYAAGFDSGGALMDVSNNVTNAFEVSPLAIGQIDGLQTGDFANDGDIMTFNLDLSNPAVVAWLQASLDAGYLEFMATSLYQTTQQASGGYPSFYTKENEWSSIDGLAPKLSGSITTVPEPSAVALLSLAGAAALGLRRPRRHA